MRNIHITIKPSINGECPYCKGKGYIRFAKFMAGETDEDHLRAAAWNILWALNQRTTHPELNDL